jgi:hypothetical protein
MRVASLLGGAALFAAAALFLHRIWGLLPSVAHAGVLTTVPLALLAAAELTFRRRADAFYSMLLSVATGLAFVMESVALGSVYNLAPSPNALLAWSAFALQVAYAYGLRLLLGAGLLLGCACVAAWGTAAAGGYWAAFMERSQFLIPPAALVYAVPWLARRPDRYDFHFVYRVCGAAAGLVALLLLSLSGHLCCGGLEPRLVEGLYQMAGLFLSVGVVVHGLRLGRGGLVNLGAAMFVVFLYARLHAWWWDWMPKYLFFLVIGLTALGLLVVFRRVRARLSRRSVP